MPQHAPEGFEQARQKAELLADNNEQTERLIDKAVAKAVKYKKALGAAWDDLQAFLRMLQAWRKGDYRKIPWKSLVSILAAVLYFVNPLDVIMDYIPFIGFMDDLAVIGFVVGSVRSDIERFLEWEKENSQPEIDTDQEVVLS